MEKEINCQTSGPCPPHEQRHPRAMNALKEAMLKLAMSRDPSRSHSQQQMLANLIDVRLPSLFSSPLRTPNHPPYAEMIYVAIGELKKKKGTTKASISNFMKSNYEDLPLAHEHLLTHHLQKLVQEGMIVSVTKSLYALPSYNYTSIEKHQQAVEQQQIVVGGEIANYDVNDNGLVALPEKHPTTALVEVVEPVDVDDSVTGLMTLPKRHCMALIEVESNGNDDNVTVGLKDLAALNEKLEPLQKKLRRCSPRLINEKREVKQPEEEAVKISEIIQSAAATVTGSELPRMICNGKEAQQAEVRQDDDEQGLIALPEKHSAAVTELESMDGDDAIGLLKKSPTALHEAVSRMVPVETDDSDLGPPWLKPMIKANYYIPCEVHGDKCDMFCVDCTGNPLCSHCSVHHKDHHIVKIRRFKHHSIIDVNEVQKYMDISGVQTYTNNKNKSVYLKDFPLRKSNKFTVTCEICSRRLHYTFRFCSLRCKIERRNSILPYMEETSRPTTDCEKQQQVGGQKLIVVGGEMENNTGLEALAEKHPENAIVEVIEPVDVDGDGLMAISGNHSMAVIGCESNGCGDSVGDGLKHSVAMTKLCQYSRRIRNKKRKFEQQEEEVANISEINASITATMNDDPSVQTELNTPSSQGQLRWCQVAISRKTNNREQQQQQELVALNEVERGLMATSENYLTAVVGLESIDGNKSDGAGSIGLLEKPTMAVLEAEQTSIQQSVGPVVSLEKLDDDLPKS
ncbi:Platz transcription factor family protein [Thalictrum thalictroides]|uniref:Platz transcription factor family protein n=1 Tax=Thalictrum thalictroides TaxID=46969 RepID=A0A7J6VW40_THATH|nr:Platz transcription factor family protein [Thalictrum thalictroides]